MRYDSTISTGTTTTYAPSIGRLVLIAALLLLAAETQAMAQLVSVTPMRVLVGSQQRTTELRVTNTSPTPVQVRTDLDFRPLRSTEDGHFYLDSVATPEEEARACDDWIKVFPRRFMLGPGESRALRVIATFPENIEDGEYWSRLRLIGERAEEERRFSAADTQRVNVNVNMKIALDIPVVLRKGKATTGIALDGATALEANDSLKRPAMLIVDARRLGNSAWRGTLHAAIRDAAGADVAKLQRPFTMLWTMNVPLRLPQLPDGIYDVDLEARAGGTAQAVADALPSEPARRGVRLRVDGGRVTLLAEGGSDGLSRQ